MTAPAPDDLAPMLASLQRERDRLEAILEAMVEGVLVTDADGAIVVANHALQEMFLVGRGVLGRAPREALPGAAALHALIAEAGEARAPVLREMDVEGLRPRRVMARVAPIDDARGSVVAVLSDVTELRRLERMRRDFVANVSHELRTPIAAMRAAAETLLDGALAHPTAAREFVTIIDRHAERLRQLVEDLLELSRIEAKELQLAPERLDLGEAVAQSLDLFRLAAERKSIALTADVPAHLPPVFADRKAVGQVLGNLVDNAIKYSADGGAVTVRARSRDDGRVRLSVEDTGIGIEARHLPRIFERFYRVDRGRSREVGGTGLGLAIVKHLAEAMGDEVSVESVIGRGSTFHVDMHTLASRPPPPPEG